MDDKIVIDFKNNPTKVRIHQRQVMEGNALVFQTRYTNYFYDGRIEETEWEDGGRITNYGDVYDKKDEAYNTPLIIWGLFAVFVLVVALA